MVDTFLQKGLRKKLVEEIKFKGISDNKILEVIDKIPRHLFLDSALQSKAYEDIALPISAGQTISQPYTVAFQTQLLDIKKGDKILEIGTGSGYQTCVLIELGARVYTIERKRDLYQKAMTFLPKIGYNPYFYYGDGYVGLPTYGPFDKILITAGAPFIPEELKKQLKTGGILVAPIGGSNVQIMKTLIKKSETEFEEIDFGHFIFVPLLKGKD
jgi:protein-L-isoaspartate(D-aspartate) O-methyltransferase